jgi:2',3'-cyclic-nucleotide 2'-phosphodiesterase (5'-nucleotidase family)
MQPILKCLITILIFLLGSHLRAEPLYLIYTSNINGALQNCGCGVDPPGGIGRVKSIIDQIRSKHQRVILIDGGDFFNSYPFPLLDEAMLKALEVLEYDLFIAGDQEFVEGSAFYNKLQMILGNRLLISNNGSDNLQSFSISLESDNMRIYGLLSPKVFNFIEVPAALHLRNPSHINLKSKNRRDLNVVVMHGYLGEAQQFARRNQSIDLVLLAHDQSKGIWDENGSLIVGNGKDSEFLSIIEARFDKKWHFKVDQVRISETIPEDDHILKIISQFNLDLEIN